MTQKERFVKIRLASSNQGKLREFKELIQDEHYELESVHLPEGVKIPETGTTFEANAKQKAEGYAKYYPGEWILAEDSGLAVDLLDGAPGVHSARYGGEDLPYPEKFQLLWSDLKKVNPDPATWTAAYISCLVLLSPKGDIYTYQGSFEGRILNEARGNHGFGYDPIFYVPEYEMTCGEMQAELKNSMSHRAKAVKAWLEDWEEREVWDE